MNTITPCLWFDTEGEEAAEFYTLVFPNSKISKVTRYMFRRAARRGDRDDRRVRVDGQPSSR